MKKTPDDISKKRQEISRQIEAWDKVVKSLNHLIPVTFEESLEKSKRIKYAYEQLKYLRQELVETQKSGRRFNLNYRNKLQPGVM